MRMFPDLTVEGTPEEVAAFKHIDAALASRNKRSTLAIEGPKKPTKATKPARARKMSAGEIEGVIKLASTKDGITAADLAAQFHTTTTTAYKRLQRLRKQGRLWLDEGVFKVPPE